MSLDTYCDPYSQSPYCSDLSVSNLDSNIYAKDIQESNTDYDPNLASPIAPTLEKTLESWPTQHDVQNMSFQSLRTELSKIDVEYINLLQRRSRLVAELLVRTQQEMLRLKTIKEQELVTTIPVAKPNTVIGQKRSIIVDNSESPVSKKERKQLVSTLPDLPEEPSDPAFGSSCHSCKCTKKPIDLVFCAHTPGKRRCRKKYCYSCLQRMQINPDSLINDNTIMCPACRHTCKCGKCTR
jgi:hypothetical protein